jgi:Uma2 family endonuclease
MAHEVLTPPTRPLPKGKISYEQFLEWLDEDTWAEWVDGEVELMSPISWEHQEVGGFLIALLRLYLASHPVGRLLYEPFQMKTGADLPGRSPDILFVSNEHLHRLKPTHLEIVSAESAERDRVQKFAEYERGGVREYWLIDPDKRQAEFYQLGEDGRYVCGFSGGAGVYHSAVLSGFWLRVEWLWQQPPLIDILREWGLV